MPDQPLVGDVLEPRPDAGNPLIVINQNVIDVAEMIAILTRLSGEWHGAVGNRLDAIEKKLKAPARRGRPPKTKPKKVDIGGEVV